MAHFFSLLMVSIAAFALGSVPFGLVIAQKACGVDPRLDGSRNVGATNVARLCGFKWGALTLVCDLLKGFVPVLIFTASSSNLEWLAYPTGLAVICGHMFSFFLHYKGGKGVATTVGVFLALAPLQLVFAGLACIALIWRSGFVSAGSLLLVTALPLLLLVSGRFYDCLFALLIAALVVYKHKDNIRRLLRGEEKGWLVKDDSEQA
ncbi:glycerol-3-phosphate acyltransferase [Desulfovibrio sp. OttesenSCG-928-F20]|nr:glycerol-3-phosphate acyltransferase [Desulfovibrio sp. OttesenSCG-928-M16]MDL2291321.1 glycerol-3-phosphate acyltransferase [Desulfovibrio sp. OttesenSCG-928-F20]